MRTIAVATVAAVGCARGAGSDKKETLFFMGLRDLFAVILVSKNSPLKITSVDARFCHYYYDFPNLNGFSSSSTGRARGGSSTNIKLVTAISRLITLPFYLKCSPNP